MRNNQRPPRMGGTHIWQCQREKFGCYDRSVKVGIWFQRNLLLLTLKKLKKKKTKLVAVGMKRDEETVFNVNVLLYFKTDLFLISHDIFISIKLYLVTPRIMLHLLVFLNTFLWVCSISYFGENVILSTHQQSASCAPGQHRTTDNSRLKKTQHWAPGRLQPGKESDM